MTKIQAASRVFDQRSIPKNVATAPRISRTRIEISLNSIRLIFSEFLKKV